jgi:hypothetical protein
MHYICDPLAEFGERLGLIEQGYYDRKVHQRFLRVCKKEPTAVVIAPYIKYPKIERETTMVAKPSRNKLTSLSISEGVLLLALSISSLRAAAAC